MFSLSLHSGGVGRRHFKSEQIGTSLVVQWLRLCAPNAGDLGLIPGQGTRSHTLHLKDLAWCSGDWRCRGLQLRPSTAQYINKYFKKVTKKTP